MTSFQNCNNDIVNFHVRMEDASLSTKELAQLINMLEYELNSLRIKYEISRYRKVYGDKS